MLGMRRRPSQDEIVTEIGILKKYALRWAVLAAWRDELVARRAALPPDSGKRLEAGRIKITSGCFSSCDVQCLLSDSEAAFVSADASLPESRVDYWVELLGRAMRDSEATEAVLGIPAIKFRYADCGIGECGCPG